MSVFALPLACVCWNRRTKASADYCLKAMKRVFSLLADKLRNIGYLTEGIIKELIDSATESLYDSHLPPAEGKR